MNFVTGGNGLVGSHVIVDLLKKNLSVRALKRPNSELDSFNSLIAHYSVRMDQLARLEWVDGDVTDVMGIAKALEGVKYVYHCAALVSFNTKDADRMRLVNYQGTANMVNMALIEGVKKFCHVSSTAAVGKTKNGTLITEQEEWNEINVTEYALSKHLAEIEVWRAHQEGLDAVIVNPSVIVGPGKWGVSSTSLFTLVWNGLRFYAKGGNAFVDVRDVSKAMLTLMESDISGERFLVIGENLKFKDFFTMIAVRLNKRSPSLRATPFLGEIAWRFAAIKAYIFGNTPVVTKESARAAQATKFYDNNKIRKALPFKFTAISDAIDNAAVVFLATKKR